MGSTLIFEENFLIGFLPLRSYFLTRKNADITGKKCPNDKEEILRCLIIKESLELLNCTPEKAKIDQIKVSESDLELLSTERVEDFFA